MEEQGRELDVHQSGSSSGTKISDEEEQILTDIYYNPRSPVAFGGIQKILKYLKSEGIETIKPKKLKIWLSRQEAYTSHRSARRRFQRPRVIAFSVNYQWDSDTANMTGYREHNDGYSHFAVFIDIFSRFLYTAPMKTLTGKEMVYIMNDLFEQTTDKPKNLRTDQGSEYKNNQVKKFLRDNRINHIFTYYETKANYAERVIKTIKLKINKYFTSKETFRWIEILPDLTFGYNQSYHRTIKMSPNQAKEGNDYQVWKNQYEINLNSKRDNQPSSKKDQGKPSKSRRRSLYKFKLGDKVKISFIKKTFDREYSEKWSGEIFTVVDRKRNQDIPMYQLKDYNNEVIESLFYEPELQLAYMDSNVVYKIEDILKRRKRNGIPEVLVKWKGWPVKFNSWIPESDVQEIN